ncbi:hypothetical protein GUI04_14565, partial [Xanthomonas citri pv. citri]|nr:hypothetical protein [Xanthomonas citri pv. citri]
TRHPWFRKGNKGIYECEDEEFLVKPEQNDNPTPLNAFDIISFSSGLNLSPFFDNTCSSSCQGEKLVVPGPPEEVIEKVHETLKEVDVRIKKR